MSQRKTEAWLYVDKKGRSLLFRNKEAADFQMAEHGGRLVPISRRDPKAEAVVRAAIEFAQYPGSLVPLHRAVDALLASRKKAKKR